MDDTTNPTEPVNPVAPITGGVRPTLEQTEERIKKLGVVGTALNQTFSEQNQDMGTDFDLAKTSLSNFLVDIEAMAISEPAKQGMRDLVAYLNKKLDKRIKASMAGEDHFD